MSNSEDKIKALRAEAEANGHDGIIIMPFRDSFGFDDTTDEFVQPQYVVFRPEQIKSAIGNNGDFDPANPDIRFSRRAAGNMTVMAGNMTVMAVPRSTSQWMAYDGGQTVRADLSALAARHPEHYDSPEAVRQDIEFVLERPDGWYIHAGPRIVLFRERPNNAVPQTRIEVEAEADSMVVRSVYVGKRRQIAKKMGEMRKVLSGLGPGGLSPGSLTIAEYLQALGNGSTRPVPPSGGHPEADDSVPRTASRACPAPSARPTPAASTPPQEGLGRGKIFRRQAHGAPATVRAPARTRMMLCLLMP